MSSSEISKSHEARLAELQAAARSLDERSNRLSTWRGVTFLLTLGVCSARMLGPLPLAVWAAAAVLGVLFLALVVAHAALVTKMAALDVRVRLADRGWKRVLGDIASFPERGDRFLVPGHAYAGDLDIFGSTSLFQLVSAAQTGSGERMLASWLSAPAPANEISARQAAVRELAKMTSFREELAVAGIATGAKGRDADPLVAWAEGRAVAPPAIAGKPPAIAIAPPKLATSFVRGGMVLVAITASLLVARQIIGPEALGPFRHAWLLAVLAQGAVLLGQRPAIDPIVAIVSSREEPFARYLGMIRLIEGQSFAAPRVAAIRAALAGPSGADASRAIASLQGIVGFAELRHSGFVHLIANTFLLWDLFCAAALARWRVRWGDRVRAWLDALAEMEALASLAAFTHEHPTFVFPEVDDGASHFEAESLGHPLIQSARRVSNDVLIGGSGSALLVTGSNMSGKSTMLRSIGVNAALALAGAPVCAARLSMASCSLRTSMRISDSLEGGISHFYAELGRLKAIVDAVNAGDKVIFLLDEVLHGTNSRERRIGARAVVLHLLDRGAVGSVSSHDLGLADLEKDSGGRVRNVHFEELVADGQMTFDYKLKPGVVTTANALRLMKAIGIAVELPEVG